jgi:hypothetical protein
VSSAQAQAPPSREWRLLTRQEQRKALGASRQEQRLCAKSSASVEHVFSMELSRACTSSARAAWTLGETREAVGSPKGGSPGQEESGGEGRLSSRVYGILLFRVSWRVAPRVALLARQESHARRRGTRGGDCLETRDGSLRLETRRARGEACMPQTPTPLLSVRCTIRRGEACMPHRAAALQSRQACSPFRMEEHG